MMGRTHLMVGAATGLALAQAGDLSAIGSSIAFAMLGSITPDIDHRGSYMGKALFPISFFVSHMVEHRGVTHSILFASVLAFSGYYFHLSMPVMTAFIAGFISHIVCDMFTVAGVKLFWPLPVKVSLASIHTGGMGEYLFSLVFIVASFFWFFKDNLPA